MAIRSKTRSLILSAGAVLLLALLHAAPASAATFTVNSTIDAPDASPGDGNCATAGGQCTVRAAVMEANALVGSDTINLPTGTYTLTLTGKNENSAATGDLDVNGGSLNVSGVGAKAPILDGNQADRVFHLGPTTATEFSLDGVTVQNGNAQSDPPAPGGNGPDVGAGIRVEKNSALEVTNALFRNGRAGERGGAIGMPTTAGSTAIGTDTSIISELTNVTIENNSAGLEAGGFFSNRVARLTNVIIRDNVVTGTTGVERGAGIANSGDLTLTDVLVDGNSMQSGNGAGIGNRGDPMANIFGTIRLTNVTVSNNSAPLGGGIASGNGATAILTNTTISGNQATNTGGAFANLGTATLSHVTISDNSAPAAGGVATFGGPPPPGAPGAANASTTLTSTILEHGPSGSNCLLPPPGPGPPFARPPTSQGDNLSSDNSCNLTGPNDRNGIDPQLGPLANNGGFTPTHALLSGSPAIDTVLSKACPPPATDQRGVSRPQNGDGLLAAVCDIGAFEHPTVVVTGPGPGGPEYPLPPAGIRCLGRAATIVGTNGRDTITGTSGADVIVAGAGNDRIDGRGGNDVICAGSGNDSVVGGRGNDRIAGNSGNDRVSGNAGRDRITGALGRDRLSGNEGADRIQGNAGDDRLAGGSGNDNLSGGSGRDRTSGNSGNDRIAGNSGKDRLFGGPGRDLLFGGSGNDILRGGPGRDRLSGGPGRDFERQ